MQMVIYQARYWCLSSVDSRVQAKSQKHCWTRSGMNSVISSASSAAIDFLRSLLQIPFCQIPFTPPPLPSLPSPLILSHLQSPLPFLPSPLILFHLQSPHPPLHSPSSPSDPVGAQIPQTLDPPTLNLLKPSNSKNHSTHAVHSSPPPQLTTFITRLREQRTL